MRPRCVKDICRRIKAAVDAGALSIMPSFSSWNGTKMHGNQYLLTDVLKKELGFDGFLISDWDATSQLPGNPYDQVVKAVNAGVDMYMGPEWQNFYSQLQQAVKSGDVPMARIDDAVLASCARSSCWVSSSIRMPIGKRSSASVRRSIGRWRVRRCANRWCC